MDIVCASPVAHQYCSVQRIWTCPNAAGDRSGAAHEFGLPNSGSSRLFGVGASTRVENGGTGERGIQFCRVVSNEKKFPITKLHAILSPNEVFYHYPINKWKQSLPVEGWIRSLDKPNPGSRSRTIFSCTGQHQIGAHTDSHKLHPYPLFHKSFARLFQKPRSLRSPRPPAKVSRTCRK